MSTDIGRRALHIKESKVANRVEVALIDVEALAHFIGDWVAAEPER